MITRNTRDEMSDSEEDEYTDLRELYQDPILTRISAVGGIEAIKLSDGSVTQEYKLGDECLGKYCTIE